MDKQFFISKFNELKSEYSTLGLDKYSFRFSNTYNSYGDCNYRMKVIRLSKRFIDVTPTETMLDVLKHEIAHAIAFEVYKYRGHGATWKEVCREVGAVPRSCKQATKEPEKRYIVHCKHCGSDIGQQQRRTNKRNHYHVKCGKGSTGMLVYKRNPRYND